MSVDEKGEYPDFDEAVDPFKTRSTMRHSPPPTGAAEYREAASSRGSVSVKCESLRGTSQGLRESTPQSLDSDGEGEAGAVVNAEEDGDLSARMRTRASHSSGSRPRAHPAQRALMRSMEQQAAARTAATFDDGDDESAGEARPAPSDSPEWPPHGRAMHSFLDMEESAAGAGPRPSQDFDHNDIVGLASTPEPDGEAGGSRRGSAFAGAERKDSARKEMMKYSDSDVVKIKQQLQAEYQQALAAKERQWEERCRKLEADNAKMRSEREKMGGNMEEMKNCVLEYERTLQQVLDDRAGKTAAAVGDGSPPVTAAGVQEIVSERDQAVEDLATVEKAFGDLHRRFEKSKQVIEAVKKNEETLKKCLQETMAKLKRHEQKYQTLKQHAEEKLDQANAEIEKARRSNEAEIARLQACLKKAELQVQGLEAQLEQKQKENHELTQICDELIAKCGNQ